MSTAASAFLCTLCTFLLPAAAMAAPGAVAPEETPPAGESATVPDADTAGPTGAAQSDGSEPAPDATASVEEPEPAEGALPTGLSEEPEPTTPVAAPPATDSETTTAATAEAPKGDLSMDDIFGTAEDLEDVEVIPEGEAANAPASPTAAGKPTFGSKFTAKLDTHFRIVSSVYYDIARVEERQFSRNENRLEFSFRYAPNDHVQVVGDVEPVFLGVAQAQELDDLATRQMLTPFHVESDAAYIAINDLIPKLDIKVGRQIVVWGTADKFNPTNNINPDDLEDRPLFTEPIANQMLVVDYAPLDDKLWFEAVYVPLFYPALLPPSAAAGLRDPQSPVPFANESDDAKIRELQQTLDITPSLVPTVVGRVQMPRRRFSDGQSALKLGTSLGGVDASISYYNGRHDVPMPLRVESSTKDPVEGAPDEAECCFRSDVILNYPRMQVLGFDFATQLPFLNNLGLWGEGALFFPGKQDLFIEFPIAVDVTPDDDQLNPVDSLLGPAVTDKPYIKATAGFDYTFGKHVYVQMQYLRGFIDEFGADHIGNYVVGGTELVFFGRHLIFRAFGVVDIPTDKADNGSYVIYPELVLVPPWGGVTFNMGSFFLLGEDDTKFGQAGAGSSIAFFKVTGAF